MKEENPTTRPLDGTISKLPGKLGRLLRHGCTLPKGVVDEIPLIKDDLEKIVSVSSDLADNHAMSARCWRKEVRELSYDMEDFVDQYEHGHAVSCSRSMLRGRKVTTQQRRKSKTGPPWLREKLRQRLWMANKIREFSTRTQEALQRHSLYDLDTIAGASASSRSTCAYSDPAWNSTPCGEENAYVGISDAMEELLMMMHDDHGDQKLKVVSIVGFGGIGKTTLATELYRKLGRQFECRAFVRTSEKPDMRRIFISMLSQVRPHQPPDNWTVHSLISTIRTHLQDKRYLIIVEDLCTASTWDIVQYALPDSNCCSRILATTEIEDLALQSCDHDPKYVYKMKPLGEDNSRKLFFGLVFGPQHECPPELREISCNIISKCGGLPLAIATVANILSRQPGVQGQWDYVNKSIGESLLTNPTWEGMKQVLDLSYNNLPQQLKACILYTSLYEEDIIIWKDDLVHQWIAEGFIQTTGGQDENEIGRSFFDRLISGKLILPVDINRNGEVLSCVVHRMVLNLVIRDKSMEENFVTAIHHSQADTTLADKVRRLSLQFGNAEDAIPPSNIRLSHVRTLAFSGFFKCLPSIEQFRLLQVLILHFWGDKDIISFEITRISELFRLRYMKVKSNVTLELGTQMRCLQSLETLAIDARVSAVPSDIVQLPGLLHLSLPAETNLPNGIGHMTSLRTLRYFDLSSNSLENVQSLSMLTNLGDLQLTCSTQEPESLNMKMPLLLNMILARLSNLKSLTLVPTRTSSYYTKSIDGDTCATCMTISDGFSTLSSAPAPLQRFEVSPRICIFFCTPKWIGQFYKLSIVKFGVRKIDRDGVDVLRGLPALAVLSLYVRTKPAARIVIGKTGFPVINYFKFKCCDPCLKFEEGAMPNLRELKLAFNVCIADRQSTIPIGLKYLSQLKEVSVKICGAGPDEESQRRANELAFRDAMRVNPRCQRVNVQCVKQIICGEEDQSSMTTMEYPAAPPSESEPARQDVKRMGTQGLPPSGVLREDGLVALNKISLKDHATAWITKGMMKSVHQPQCKPVLDGYQGARYASVCVAHNALASLESNLLKDWAATNNIAPNVNSLKLELISVKAILESTLGKVVHNSALEHSLMMLQDLVYDAEDVVDEMEYFHIQDMLDADQHAGAHNQDLIVLPSISDEPPEMIFDKVDASNRMKHIVERMQEMQRRISGIMTHSCYNWSTISNIAQSRPISTSESVEPKLYGRELMMKSIVDDITKGKHSGEVLTVIPIVGPGGIGKTTLAQHVYHNGEVQQHFDVKVWTCVSLNFNVNKLIEEVQRYIPKVEGESTTDTTSELIGKRLKNRRLLLVLDDIWDCSDEDEWKRLLVPFRKSQVQGNIILATTRFHKQAQILTQKADHSIYLQGIENKEFEELFLEIIFGDDDQSMKDYKFLFDIGFKIAGKLKGSPLAAKTVGRLLKRKLDLDHWERVLESKEWEKMDGKNDIMPALKLSFDYLPPQLQQCFSYCALFPQDYKFDREELINFWIGLEVLHSSLAENKRVEDIGLSHLNELVNCGLLEKMEGEDGRTCYIINDLLHELVRKASSLECLRIDSSQSKVRSIEVLPSIRHLSINIDGTTAKDRLTLKSCVEDFTTLGTRLQVGKLRSLMIFGEHHGCFVKAFGDLFREAKALRLVFLSRASYDVKDLLHNFYFLIHLRYLRIERSSLYKASFPDIISRFYHMKVLDAKCCDIIGNVLPRDISNLVKLRHLLVQYDTIHSSIIDVGKLKSLQELRRFVVKQDDQGFKLRQIGHLEDLYGSLCICSLENVQVPEEADEAKLMLKWHLHELKLCWDINRFTNDSALEEHVLERLKPSRNLQELSIIGHSGGACPSWLGMNLSLSSLKSLCLNAVAWKTFPPIGDLQLVNVLHEEISINIPEKKFGNLRRLELENLSELKTWAVHAPCQLFPYLEVLIIRNCCQLVELSFSHSAGCCQQGKYANDNLFSRLSMVEIGGCPQLSSFPRIPWTEALCSISIQGTSSLDRLFCEKGNNSEYSLTIEGNNETNDSTFWNVLAFRDLTGLKKLGMSSCQFPPLRELQMLSSLRTLEMSCSSNVFPFLETDSHVKYQFPVESLTIDEWNSSGMELTQLLTYFPKLSVLRLWGCKKVTGLAVNVKGQQVTETPGPSSSANINKVKQQQGARVAGHKSSRATEAAVSEEAECGLLLLPPQLQELLIDVCPKLSLLRSNPHDDSNKEDGRTGGGGGLRGLTSLRRLEISNCPELLSSYSSSSFSSSFPFPNSLEHLDIYGVVGTEVLLPLSNHTSLTSLTINHCGDLRGEGLLSLLAQGHLTKLCVTGMPNFFVDSEPPWVHEQGIPSCSFKLQELEMGDVAGFTAASIRRSLIFSSLTKLKIYGDNKVKSFTKEQDALLFANSLEEIRFMLCPNLQSLPKRLHGLRNLRRLQIRSCGAIQMLPKDVLPSSLEELDITDCPKIQSLPKDCLPDSLQKLVIRRCPAIQSLPKVDDLPTSLRELDVIDSDSEELKSQCRRFINIVPIVKA